MIVTIHQPEFLPYGGFFAKAMRADLFVLLDTVQFKKNYFENRNRVIVNGEARYVTVPIVHHNRLESTFADIQIADDPRWAKRMIATLRSNYCHHPRFDRVFPPIERILEQPHTHLAPLNIQLIHALAEQLEIDVPWVVGSDLTVRGKQSQLLADLTADRGGDTYLAGALGRDYLDLTLFEQLGLTVTYHDFHAQPYPQPGMGEFVPNLSVFDLLCNCEPAACREILLAGSEVNTH